MQRPLIRPLSPAAPRSGAVVSLACLLLCGALPAAGQIPGYAVIPMTLMDGSNQALLQLKVNGRSTALILDTGASATTLDSAYYKGVRKDAGGEPSSKLPPELQHQKPRMNGEKVEIGYVDSLVSAGMDFGGGPVFVADMSTLFGGYNRRHSTKISGVLGEDVLRKYGAIIDWGRHAVYFNTVPAKRLKLGPGLTAAGWTAVPMTTTHDNHFTVPCNVEAQPVRLIVDTGAAFTVFDKNAITLRNTMYNRDNGGHLGHLAVNEIRMNMFGLDSPAFLATLENWKIGGYPVAHSVVLSQATPPGLVKQGSDADGPTVGLLGAEVLAANHAIVDVAGSILYLKPPAPPALPGRSKR